MVENAFLQIKSSNVHANMYLFLAREKFHTSAFVNIRFQKWAIVKLKTFSE